MADFAFFNRLFPWNKPSTPTPTPTPTPTAAPPPPLRPDKGKSPVPGLRASRSERTLDSAVKVLPVLAKVAAQLGDTFPKRDPRYASAVNIETAAYVLEDLLLAIRKSQDAAAFEHDISAVADCLEELLAIASRPRPPELELGAKVVHLPPPPCFWVLTLNLRWQQGRQQWPAQRPHLSAVAQSVADQKDCGFAHQHLYDELISFSAPAWRDLSQRLNDLATQLENGIADPVADKPAPDATPRPSSRPDWEFKDFVTDAWAAAACICPTEQNRDIRFRLGTYKKEQGRGEASHVTILIGGARPPADWTEIRLHPAEHP